MPIPARWLTSVKLASPSLRYSTFAVVGEVGDQHVYAAVVQVVASGDAHARDFATILIERKT